MTVTVDCSFLFDSDASFLVDSGASLLFDDLCLFGWFGEVSFLVDDWSFLFDDLCLFTFFDDCFCLFGFFGDAVGGFSSVCCFWLWVVVGRGRVVVRGWVADLL